MPLDPHSPCRRGTFDDLLFVLQHDMADILYLNKEAALDRSFRTLSNDGEITLEPTNNYDDFCYKGDAHSPDTLLHR